MQCRLKLLSSLEKVFFDECTHIEEHTSGSMMKNEIYSFQLACYVETKLLQGRFLSKIKVKSELEPFVQIKQIDYVSGLVPTFVQDSDDDYITKEPGLFPDPLKTIKDGVIVLAGNQSRSFWITVDPKGLKVGNYDIQLEITNYEDEFLAETCFHLEIMDAELPELDICNTGWLHGDCIAKLHNVEVFSDEYWDILEKYLTVYTKFGHNMILTPLFTPPLDTMVGGERPTNQLVTVIVNKGRYSFDFDNLKKWIELCHRCGIKYFEMSHLFTQWGAKHAPKIMAKVDEHYKRIFGWETDALSEEYSEFLHNFLTELVAFLKAEDIMENCYFHVSDEPKKCDEEQYQIEKGILLAHIKDSKIMDALSDYSFYEKGIVSTPVVACNHLQPFLENDVKGLWTYYCMSQRKDVPNRFMAMPAYRNRILGYLLYKYDIKGFLHWGFNFWFTQLSLDVLDPYHDTSAGSGFPSGDAFIVYPLDNNGEVVCSTRLYVFNEALQDLRALKLLEDLTDRATVMELLCDIDDFANYPRNNQYITNLRKSVNRKIQSCDSDFVNS